MAKRFVYKRLAKKHGIWRVDGIGVVSYSQRGSSRLMLHLSGIQEEFRESPYVKEALNGQYLALSIHPASARHFLVGSLWRDGSRIYLPPQEKSDFFIDTNLASYRRLREGVEINEIHLKDFLPPAYFKMARESYQGLLPTGYFVVPVQPGAPFKWMIVPASEVLRFYFGTSERLLHSIINGSLSKFVDWERSRIDNYEPVLHVEKNLSRLEAFVLGRALENKQAFRALTGVQQYLAGISIKNKTRLDQEHAPLPFVLRTEFPFLGRTRLRVSGKRIVISKPGDSKEWAIFAMFIDQCNHSLGFSRVIQESDIPRDVSAPGDRSSSGRPQLEPQIEDEEKYEFDDVPADAKIKRVVSKTFTNQFPAFARMKFEHKRPIADPSYGRPPIPGEVPVRNLTINDGEYSADASNNVGVSGFDSFAYETETALTQFIEAINHLRKLPGASGWQIQSHNLTGQQNLTLKGERLAYFPEHIKRVRSWHIVELPSGDTRPRQVMLIEIKLDKARFYICEMELKNKEAQCTIVLFRQDFSIVEDDEFRELLILTALRNRWPEAGKTWEKKADFDRQERFFIDHGITRIHHPAETVDKKTKMKIPVKASGWAKELMAALEHEVLPRIPT